MARKPSDTPPDPPNSGEEGSAQSENAGGFQNDGATELQQDDEQYVPDPENEGAAPTPSEEELDAVDKLEKKRDEEHEARIIESVRKVMNLATAYPSTTPDEQVITGLGSHRLTVGDVRRIAIHAKRKHRGE